MAHGDPFLSRGGCVSVNPNPRTFPVNVPMPEYSGVVTVVTVDKDGNMQIWTDQPPYRRSEPWKPCRSCIDGACISTCERD